MVIVIVEHVRELKNMLYIFIDILSDVWYCFLRMIVVYLLIHISLLLSDCHFEMSSDFTNGLSAVLFVTKFMIL